MPEPWEEDLLTEEIESWEFIEQRLRGKRYYGDISKAGLIAGLILVSSRLRRIIAVLGKGEM